MCVQFRGNSHRNYVQNTRLRRYMYGMEQLRWLCTVHACGFQPYTISVVLCLYDHGEHVTIYCVDLYLCKTHTMKTHGMWSLVQSLFTQSARWNVNSTTDVIICDYFYESGASAPEMPSHVYYTLARLINIIFISEIVLKHILLITGDAVLLNSIGYHFLNFSMYPGDASWHKALDQTTHWWDQIIKNVRPFILKRRYQRWSRCSWVIKTNACNTARPKGSQAEYRNRWRSWSPFILFER